MGLTVDLDQSTVVDPVSGCHGMVRFGWTNFDNCRDSPPQFCPERAGK